MWKWTLNWNEITADLAIGSCPMTTGDIDHIAGELRPTALLSVQHDTCLEHFNIDYPAHVDRAEQLGMVTVRCPIRDFDTEDMRQRLPSAVAALCQLLTCGHRVYLYCTAGIGRSALVAFAYLTLVQGYTREKASEVLHERRPSAAPDLDAYHGCRQDLVERLRVPIEERAWEISHQRSAGDAAADWYQAEAEIIRETLAGTPPHGPTPTFPPPAAGETQAMAGAARGELEQGLAALVALHDNLDRMESMLTQCSGPVSEELLADLEHTAKVLREMTRSAVTIPVASPPALLPDAATRPRARRR